MKRPSRYYVEWWVGDISQDDAPLETETFDCETLKDARAKFKEMSAVRIMERYNIVDDTPPDCGRGLMWDWQEREIHS